MRRLLVLVLCLTVAGTVLAACGDDDDGDGGGAAAAVSVSDPWARASAGMANAGAAYMVLEADTDDALVKASVPSTVAARVELHETVAASGGSGSGGMGGTGGMGSGGSGAESGAMSMRPVGEIELPAGEEVALEPGGLHVMLLELAKPLTEGQTIRLTLTFEEAGEMTVEVPVRK